MPKIQIELALALENEQILEQIIIEEGTPIEAVMAISKTAQKYPNYFVDDCILGVFGRKIDKQYRLNDGDRIEIYRPLKVDPKLNRRIRSLKS